MTQKFIGKPVGRIEDEALLKGGGRFVDDLHLPNMLEAAFVRSPLAHAKITSIDVSAARAAAGVHAVFCFDDLRPHLMQDRLPLELRLDPLPPNITPFPLAKDEVVFVGEAVAVVIAEFAISRPKTRRCWWRSSTNRWRRYRTACRPSSLARRAPTRASSPT